MSETLDNHEWLARSGLDWEAFMKMPPATQAMVGLQWKQYSAYIQEVCREIGVRPEQLEGFPKKNIPFRQPELMPKTQQQTDFEAYRNQYTLLPQMRKAQGLA